MIYEEFVDSPQEVWVVTADFLEEDKAAVCAYLEGRIAAKQWLGEGDDHTTNQDEAVEIGSSSEHNIAPAEGDLSEWGTEIEGNWAMDGGAPADAFEEWNQDMIDNGNVSEGFDWKDHVDFSCLWEAQDKLGLEQNPSPDDL